MLVNFLIAVMQSILETIAVIIRGITRIAAITILILVYIGSQFRKWLQTK